MDSPATDVAATVLAAGAASPGHTALDWSTAVGLDIEDSIEADAAAIMATVGGERAEAPPGPAPPPLTNEQRAILEFERQWWRRPGAKEQAIRDQFDMSPTRYYQALNQLLDLPEALSYDPTLVHRLLRLRSSSARSRRLT